LQDVSVYEPFILKVRIFVRLEETDIKTVNDRVEQHREEIINLHVHRPPAVTLNETPEEFHISTGLCQKIKSNLLRKSLDIKIKSGFTTAFSLKTL
jgi:hypothetical protein